MNERNTYFDWSFGLQWLVASAIGLVIGGAIAFVSMWSIGEWVSEVAGDVAGGLVAGVLFGGLFALGANVGPGLLLGRKGLNPARWIGYSVIAGALSAGIAVTAAINVLETMSEPATAVFFGLVLGLPIGISQWRVLRGQGTPANEWPIISVVAYLLAAVVLVGGNEDTNMFITLSGMALLLGAATALGIVWLIRRQTAAAA